MERTINEPVENSFDGEPEEQVEPPSDGMEEPVSCQDLSINSCSDNDCLCHFVPLSEFNHEEYKSMKASMFSLERAPGLTSGSLIWRWMSWLRRYRLKKYYRLQNSQIQQYLEAYAVIHAANHETPLADLPMFPDEVSTLLGNLSVILSYIANIVLVVVKILAVYVSGSMAVYASMLDSLLDVVSGTVLFLTTMFSRRGNAKKYPMGRSRWVSIGIIMFATIMASFSLTLIRDNIQVLTVDRVEFQEELNFEWEPILIMGGTIVTKLVLFLICRFIGRTESAKAYAQDHINDVFSNIAGLIFGLLGFHLFWAIDPLGSTVMASIIIYIWMSNAYQQIINLVGKSGPTELNNKLTFLAMHHDARILRVDFVETFHFGDNYIVEIHIVLDPDTILSESHEIEESLKSTLELLPEVDRAYCHLDYAGGHQPIDEHKVLVRG